MRIQSVELFLESMFFLAIAVLTPVSVRSAGLDLPPTITVNFAERQVRAYAKADDIGTPEDDTTSTLSGPFAALASRDATGSWGSTAEAEASQKSQISSFSIRGQGVVSSEATLGGDQDSFTAASSHSELSVQFTVPIDAPFTLSGHLEADGQDAEGDCLSFANVSLAGFDSAGLPFIVSRSFACSSPPEDAAFLFSGTVLADQNLYLSVEVLAVPRGDHYEEVYNDLGQGQATFDFVLDFGDRDGDGLLNEWEEEGIDFDGVDPVDIDLPALGADPDHKDLFVEVDVMDSVPFDPLALHRVEQSFASAPGQMVDNPDGASGIRLHLIYDDGDQLPSVSLSTDDWAEFVSLKDTYFGSPADRAHPNADLILQTRKSIFRYCVWGDTIFLGPDRNNGVGETPGDDFVIAATDVALQYPENPTSALAGAFMHELGHNLGLQHGGQDEINFKPNYLSVMNYFYAYPIHKVTQQGTNVEGIWRLDYSRSTLATVDELEIRETDPLRGPRYRKIIFNSAATDEPPVGAVADADSTVDWNANGLMNEPTAYRQNLNRITMEQPADLQVLESFTDWDRLWYALSGAFTFDSTKTSTASTFSASPAPTPGPDLENEVFEEILALDWVDQTDPSRIFADGFESAATLAWSSWIP